MPLPYLTPELAPIDAEFRSTPDDFEVDELPAYAPSGSGDHVFAHIEKRGLTTRDAVRALCERLEVDPQGAGWAGLKDRHAVTRQWVSLAGTTPEAVLGVELEGVRVLDAAPHGQKLRTGHLRANRFRIRLRELDPSRIEDLRAVLSSIESQGLPNYYGEQRFGRDGDNAVRARHWVTGEARPPRSAFHRKLQMSALQSEIFNRCVATRVENSTLAKVFAGDVMKKHGSGGVFVAEDGGDLVGFSICFRRGEHGYVSVVAVVPTHRRRGIASALVGRAVGYLRSAGVATVRIDAYVDALAAVATYRSLGFEVYERVDDDHADPRGSAEV